MKIGNFFLFVIIGVILGFIIRGILFSILVPDICAYHNGKESGFFISTFYDTPGWNGFHPAPNLLNNILTAIVGGLIGIIIYISIEKSKKRKNALQHTI